VLCRDTGWVELTETAILSLHEHDCMNHDFTRERKKKLCTRDAACHDCTNHERDKKKNALVMHGACVQHRLRNMQALGRLAHLAAQYFHATKHGPSTHRRFLLHAGMLYMTGANNSFSQSRVHTYPRPLTVDLGSMNG